MHQFQNADVEEADNAPTAAKKFRFGASSATPPLEPPLLPSVPPLLSVHVRATSTSNIYLGIETVDANG